MIEFIDQIKQNGQVTTQGTAINRANLMAIQGFISTKTVFTTDTSGKDMIIQTNGNGETLTTVFNADGSITETFVGSKTISKTTKFNDDGSIEEIIT